MKLVGRLNFSLSKLSIYFFTMFLSSCNMPSQNQESDPPSRFEKAVFENSAFISNKNYEVFLPASYHEDPQKRYPVLYMMDLQNLFVDSLAYGGVAWNAHEVIDSLVNKNIIQEVIIVGIDHAGADRFAEYMPQKPTKAFLETIEESPNTQFLTSVYSDSFLLFLTKELKPAIDQNYRTLPDVSNTFIAGSSMGGLISMYAQCEYPEVFGGALCLSTHWPIAVDDSSPEIPAQLINYFANNLPANKKWYFDYGTRGLDQYYERYQVQVDSILIEKGYVKDQNFISLKFDNHDHNEKYWNERLHIPLKFVLAQ